MLFAIIGSIISLFDTPRRNIQEFFFPKVDYNVIYGIPGKVDRPGVNVRTWFGSPIPEIEKLNGRLDTHIVGKPLYRMAYNQRLKKSFYNTETGTQISPYSKRIIGDQRLKYLSGKSASARDMAIGYDDPGPYDVPVYKDTFYLKCKLMQN